MFLVEMVLRLGYVDAPLTDDDITDLIEKLIDELDHLPVEPSVGTAREGEDITMTVGVVVDVNDEFEALSEGSAIIAAGLKAVGLARRSDVDLQTTVRLLQPA